MTVAALESLMVDRFFQRHAIGSLNPHTHQLQKRLAKAHQEAWSAATSMDYRYRTTEGKPISAATRFVNWYWLQLMELLVDHAPVYRTFLEVLHLLKPSIALFQPLILGQVLSRSFGKFWHRAAQHET
ncbi:hypothetical protein [Leptolyngbya ohadii]|uniref:hypothetical protein n=1 Tax=Leptolyngbya ohadii TaxID=1962290 RepID=UPI000B5A06AE|nr:hypothetical protein [Leptolyngbya ohadii]